MAAGMTAVLEVTSSRFAEAGGQSSRVFWCFPSRGEVVALMGGPAGKTTILRAIVWTDPIGVGTIVSTA
jgi:ABC-type branched-subunit amino acid transport system ATPase component